MTSWQHPDTKSLATALGVTARQVATWRTAGAPIPINGPADELAVRLWVAALPKAKALKPAEGPLAVYADLLAALGTSGKSRASADDTPADALKREQRKRVQILNAKDQQTLVAQARSYLSGRVAEFEGALKRRLTAPIPLDDLRAAPDAAALARRIENGISDAIAEALSAP